MSMEVRDIIIYTYNYVNLNLGGGGGGGRPCSMLQQALVYKLYECTYTCACINIHILLKKRCNLDAIIYNQITSIVNVIRLKLFTLISIVNKQ